MRAEVGLLRRVAAALGEAATLDDIARCTLSAALELPGVFRAGVALNRGGGRQLQFVSSDEDRLGPSLRWCLIDAFDRLPLNDAVRTGDDVLVKNSQELAEGYPALAAMYEGTPTRSVAALVLSTGDEKLGGLLLNFDHEQKFDKATRWLLAAFAAQVTQRLRRERAAQAERTTAEALQRSLMLTALPDPQGLELSARYLPGGLNSEVGGDWYDVFDLAGGATALVVGDVMGKGAAAALLMGEVRTALGAYSLVDPTPSAVFAQLDRFVTRRTEPDQLVTVVYALVAPDRRSLTLAVAGHPPPLMLREREVRYVADRLSPALGLGGGPWRDTFVPMEAGDSLLMFSDGLVQGRDVDIYMGMLRLRERLTDLPVRRRTPRNLCAEARSVMSDVAGSDDVTLLAMTATRHTARRAKLDLSADPRAAGVARRFLRDTVRDWGADADTLETAELCVSELVTNAVMHGGTSATVCAELDEDLVTVVVEDHGGRGAVQHSSQDAMMMVSGRGLTLVDALTAAWGAEQVGDSTTVWFELELHSVTTSEPA